MSTSISATLFAVIIAVSNAIVAIFGYMLAKHKTKNDKDMKKSEKIENAEKKLEDACNNGSISDLIDATKEIGNLRK